MNRSLAVALLFLGCGEGSPKSSTDDGREVQQAAVGGVPATEFDAGGSPVVYPVAGGPASPAPKPTAGPMEDPAPAPAEPPVATIQPVTDAGQPTAPAPVPTPEPVPDSTPDAGQGVIAEPETDAGPAEPMAVATCDTPEKRAQAQELPGSHMQGCPYGTVDEAEGYTWCKCELDWWMDNLTCAQVLTDSGRAAVAAQVTAVCGEEPERV